MLEDHPTCFPYDTAVAKLTTDELHQYGMRLENQLHLDSIIGKHDPDGEQIWTIDISASTSTSSFQKLYWESLEECFAEVGALILVRRLAKLQTPEIAPSVTTENDRSRQDNTTQITDSLITATSRLELNPPKRAFNVLIVISRPDKEHDINPLIAIEAMYDALQTHLNNSNGAIKSREDLPIKLEVSRPGTYTALEEHLASRTAAWTKAGGSGGWFDLVHFDCHGVIRDGKANLLFLSNSGKKALRKPAAKIGDLLRKYHVPTAVLHACESAKVGPDEESNMAQTLVRAGLKTVVAMAFKFTSSAAKIFTRAFYEELQRSPTFDVQIALRAARLALMVNTQRVGRFNVVVELLDSIIPILYVADDVSSPIGPAVETLNNLHNPSTKETKPTALSEVDVRCSLAQGREKDVLEIEWSLLRTPSTNIVMITGEPGIGKSYLIFRVLLPLWVPSQLSFATVSHWDLRLPNPARIIPALQALRHPLSDEKQKTRKITILENLHEVTHPMGVNTTEFGPENLRLLKEVIHELLGTNNLVILCSRSTKNVLSLPESQIHHLGPLPKYYAEAFVTGLIQELGKEDFWKDQRQAKYLEHVLGRYNYNPSSLEIFIESMVEAREKWFRQGVGREEQDKMGIFPDTPELLFNMSIRDAIGVNQSQPLAQELLNFLRRLLEKPGRHHMEILKALSVPSNVYRSDWHSHVAAAITRIRKLEEPLTGQAVDDFVLEHLIDSGWMNSFETIFPGGVTIKYYSIHPVFTNILRTLVISQPECDVWLSILTEAHIDFYGEWARNNVFSPNKREMIFKLQVESFAFMNALDSLVYTLELNEMPQELREVNHVILMWLIQCLSRAASDTNSPILEMDLIIARIEKALKYFMSRINAVKFDKSVPELKPLGSIGHAIDLYKSLCNWYQIRNPKFAGYFADCCLRLVVLVCPILDWDVETRASVASILIARGKCYLGFGSMTGFALQAFEMALRCFKVEDESDAWQKEQSISIRKAAYSGLLTSIELLKLAHSVSEISNFQEIQAVAHTVDADATLSMPSLSQLRAISDKVHSPDMSDPETLDNFRLASFYTAFQKMNQAARLLSSNQPLQAKQVLIDGLGDAMLKGDTFAEYNMRLSLIDLAEEAQDWDAASNHIARTLQLEGKTSGGLWYSMLPPDRLMREARHGVIFLHKHDIISALICFDRGYEARSGFYHPEAQRPVSPETFIENVLEVGRYVLFNMTALNTQLLTYDEFLAMDDLLVDLTVAFIQAAWPSSDLTEDAIRQLMERSEHLNNMRGKTFEKVTADIAAPASNWRETQIDTRELTHSKRNWSKEANERLGEDLGDLKPNPPRVKVEQNQYVDNPCDIGGLEEGMPLFDADPEGELRGRLGGKVPELGSVSWVFARAKGTLQRDEEGEGGGAAGREGEGELMKVVGGGAG